MRLSNQTMQLVDMNETNSQKSKLSSFAQATQAVIDQKDQPALTGQLLRSKDRMNFKNFNIFMNKKNNDAHLDQIKVNALTPETKESMNELLKHDGPKDISLTKVEPDDQDVVTFYQRLSTQVLYRIDCDDLQLINIIYDQTKGLIRFLFLCEDSDLLIVEGTLNKFREIVKPDLKDTNFFIYAGLKLRHGVVVFP